MLPRSVTLHTGALTGQVANAVSSTSPSGTQSSRRLDLVHKLGINRTGHMSFLTGQDRTPKFAGQVLPDRTESGLTFYHTNKQKIYIGFDPILP